MFFLVQHKVVITLSKFHHVFDILLNLALLNPRARRQSILPISAEVTGVMLVTTVPHFDAAGSC